MPAFAGQLRVVHQVEMVAMNGDDTDTFVPESSTSSDQDPTRVRT